MASAEWTPELETTVFVFHGPLLYTARVRAIFKDGAVKAAKSCDVPTPNNLQGSHYFIRYKGYGKDWDEWVPLARIRPYTTENIRRKKQLIQTALSASGQKSQVEIITTDPPEDSLGHVFARLHTPEISAKLQQFSGPVFVVNFPTGIRRCLVEDCRQVVAMQKRLQLPRKPCFAEIMEDFASTRLHKHAAGHTADHTDGYAEFTSGFSADFTTLFDRSVSLVVYDGEKTPMAPASASAGPEHVLRYLAIAPGLMCKSLADPEVRAMAQAFVQRLVNFMESMRESYAIADCSNYS